MQGSTTRAADVSPFLVERADTVARTFDVASSVSVSSLHYIADGDHSGGQAAKAEPFTRLGVMQAASPTTIIRRMERARDLIHQSVTQRVVLRLSIV